MRSVLFRGFLRRVLRVLMMFGIDVRAMGTSTLNLPRFFKDAKAYKRATDNAKFPIRWRDVFPALGEATQQAGVASGHYFHQDLWAARKIYETKPPTHVDVGSRVDGFVAHVLTFMPVEVVDIRPLESQVEGLTFRRMSAVSLADFSDDSIQSLSCLHALEHFGLGRYGDEIDPDAPFRAVDALSRVLAPGGHLYLSVPVGRERLEFNAHRIFNPSTVVDAFVSLRLLEFSAVTDGGDLVRNCDLRTVAESEYACGLFEFTKPGSVQG